LNSQNRQPLKASCTEGEARRTIYLEQVLVRVIPARYHCAYGAAALRSSPILQQASLLLHGRSCRQSQAAKHFKGKVFPARAKQSQILTNH
jgi:hypothetical protein